MSWNLFRVDDQSKVVDVDVPRNCETAALSVEKPYILQFGAGSEASSGFHKDSMKIYTGPGIDKSDREVTRLTQVMRLEDEFSLHK